MCHVSLARETTLTLFIMHLSPLTSEVYFLINLLKNLSIMLLGIFLVLLVSEKIKPEISCRSSAKQTSSMKCQD